MMNAGDMIVAAPERWDEACFTVPAVRAMIASGLRTGILCQPSQRDFWQTISDLVIVDFPVKSKINRIAASIAGNWQASLAWEAGLAANVFKRAKIAKRLGPSEKKLVKQLTDPLHFSVNPLEHRVQFYLAALKELGVRTDSAEFFAAATLQAANPSDAILLYPDSDFGPSHEWPIDRWQEIAIRLVEANHRVSVAHTAEAGNLAELLASRLGDRVLLLAGTPLAASLPMLADHSVVIAADGSLPHLAAHAGATCITLFGPNAPAWKRPLGRRHRVVRRHVECAPCLLAKCPLDHRCQNELEIDRVWESILTILGDAVRCIE